MLMCFKRDYSKSVFLFLFVFFISCVTAYPNNTKQIILVSTFNLLDKKTPIYFNLEKDFSENLAKQLRLLTNYTVLTDLSKSMLVYSDISDEIIFTGDIVRFQPSIIDSKTGKKMAIIEVDLQLISAKKGTVISTKKITIQIPSSQYSLGYSGQWSINSSAFTKSALGKAYQGFLAKAVLYIKKTLKNPV